MQPRSERDRRVDRLSSDHFDLAVLTARAFDLDAAFGYLRLVGVSNTLMDRFARHYPDQLRTTMMTHHAPRRRRRNEQI